MLRPPFVTVTVYVTSPALIAGLGATVWLMLKSAADWTPTQAENSDVLPFVSVAVAVIDRPTVTGEPTLAVNEKLALPLASVVTVVLPRYVSPSP